MDSWTIKLPRTLSERLARLAKTRHLSRSALVREALERLVEGPEVETFVERASRHLGAGKDLSADLLTNPRHMRGYGRSAPSRRGRSQGSSGAVRRPSGDPQ